MSRLQVDPKLFVTCRLCLEDTGQYQIDPTVQKQIKYCFDIHVESYDGLPQLICQKCEKQLSEYHKIKETYIQKQERLKSALIPKDSIQSQQGDVSSSQVVNDDQESSHENITEDTEKKRRLSKRNRIISQSSSSSDSESPTRNKIRKYSASSYQSDSSVYEFKKFVCRLCHSCFVEKSGVLTHLQNSHQVLKTKFKHILNHHCTVNLIKHDNMPNPTGIRNTVVISNDRIIAGQHPNFYVTFSTRETVGEESKLNNDNLYSNLSQITQSTEDTIVMDDNEDKTNTVSDNEGHHSALEIREDFINVDDVTSEDSDVEKMVISRKNRIKQSKSLPNDINKTIQSIITICQSRYKSKKAILDSDSPSRSKSPDIENQLQRKVLNIGRKSLYKQGFKCTGLLRYLEHKNLEILWFQKIFSDTEPNSNVIHINTKLKIDKVDHNAGWAPFYQSKQGNQSSMCFNVPITAAPLQTSDDDKKLLNPNPVPNPKQLPKKNNLPTDKQKSYSNKKKHNEASTSKKCIPKVETDSFTLPVITSTTSLAPSQDKPLNVDDNQAKLSNFSKTIKVDVKPQIRVKSDSELMSEEVLMNRNKIQSVADRGQLTYNKELQQSNDTENQLKIQPTPPKTIENQGTKLPKQEPSTAVSSTSTEYVILDTVDLPNTKTESPFGYIRKLLNMYNIILLETIESLNAEYVCLIKFKVCFKQELKDSVILCLSLYCKKNYFCIKVKDKMQENVDIDVSKISAVWQWEIIKVFRGDIDAKMLHNARKVSQEVYEYVESFLCLLRSIKFEKAS